MAVPIYQRGAAITKLSEGGLATQNSYREHGHRVPLGVGNARRFHGGPLQTTHIVGGGTQNRQLCQATADACGRQVVAGPVEATAIGNVMMQAVAAGAAGSIAQARDVVRRSCTVETYEPKQTAAWDAAYERFQAMTTVNST
ncbi:MAG: hypothetical protein HY000_31395 [Planctomycetes bacterium]|nr:hypothetical protein [Planctomycetota bacterium]